MKSTAKHIKPRPLTAEETDLVNWFKEDFFWYNEVKTLTALQERDLELIKRMGDINDEIITQVNEAKGKADELTAKITARRKYKRELFAALSIDVKSVLEMRYLCYSTFEEIAESLEYSYQSVVRKHNKGIILLNIILGGKRE